MSAAETADQSAALILSFNDEVDHFREVAWTGHAVESVIRVRAIIELLQASTTDELLETASLATMFSSQSS